MMMVQKVQIQKNQAMVNNNYLNQFGGRIFRTMSVVGLSVAFVALSTSNVKAQSVGVTDGATITPSPKSLLDLRLDNTATVGKGVLIPRVSYAQRMAMTLTDLPGPATERGMLVYQFDDNVAPASPKGFYSWDGQSWGKLLDEESIGWSTVGNAGLSATTNFLGTTDNVGLRFRTNNLDRISVGAGGNVGIGEVTALERLQVNGNLALSEGADRRLYVAPATTNVSGYDLSIEAGNAPSPAASAQPGGHLVLQAGAGYAHTNAGAGGNVVLRSGGNSYGNSPSLATEWGEIVFETGNNGSNAPIERMRISKLGKLTIGDLISGGPSVVTATSTGQLAGLSGGSANQVLKMNSAGTAIEWGPAVASSLGMGGAVGDMLYYNGTGWVQLSAPGTSAGSAGVYWALTMPNAGTGTPIWSATTAFTTTGDDMGDHTATTTLDMAGNRIEKVAEVVCSSDLRYKKDIEPINDALASVLKMNGVTYDWRKDEFPQMGFGTNRQVGLIAQELEQVFPIVVNTDEKGYKSVNYAHMVAILIEAIKDQQEIIEGQRDELTSLKGMNDQLNSLKASVELLTEHIRTSQK